MNWEHLIEAYKWPLSVVFLVILFMFIFYRPIRTFIDRIKGISREGIQTWMEAQKSGEHPISSSHTIDEMVKRLGGGEFFDLLPQKLLKDTENGIMENLKTKNMADSVASIPVLVKYIAAVFIAFVFENLYMQIWGSQLSILTHLNSNLEGETKGFIQNNFYLPAANQYPAIFTDYPFENYIGFLKTANLIAEEQGKLKITEAGRNFLVYIMSMGKPLNKWY